MLLHALADSAELVAVGESGDHRRFPAVGYPRFPTSKPGIGLAYIAITEASGQWQVVVAVTDWEGEIVDIVPGAAVFAPPVWSSDGSRLLFVRGDGVEAEAVVWHRDDGRTQVEFSHAGLRSAAWAPDGRLVYSIGGSVYEHEGSGTLLAEVPAARGLLEYGSDDLYVTVDQLCVAPDGRIAAVERWYRQGLAPSEHIVTIGDSGYDRGEQGRFPQWGDGSLLLTSIQGSAKLEGEATALSAGWNAHSICWA